MKKQEYKLTSSIATYSFDSLGDSLRRLTIWNHERMITERETAKFIIQLFHQIPEDLYNDIVNET